MIKNPIEPEVAGDFCSSMIKMSFSSKFYSTRWEDNPAVGSYYLIENQVFAINEFVRSVNK